MFGLKTDPTLLDLAEIKTRFFERVLRKPARLREDRPTFSFTFDDVPLSALENGVPILEEAGVTGTFYLAAGLAERNVVDEAGSYISLEQAAVLHESGHHIGCHTYSHYSLKRGSASGLQRDTERNRATFRSQTGIELEDFSYPFGEVGLGAKWAMRDVYASLRSNRPGVNRGSIDLGFLRAEQLYSRRLDRAHVARRIEECAGKGGWLIFYTHGVTREAGAWDVDPEDLRWAVEECLGVAGQVLDVRRARQRLLVGPDEKMETEK